VLDAVLTHTARLGDSKPCSALSHRGRLATLEQILRRPGRDLFAQFEDVEPERRWAVVTSSTTWGSRPIAPTPTAT